MKKLIKNIAIIFIFILLVRTIPTPVLAVTERLKKEKSATAPGILRKVSVLKEKVTLIEAELDVINDTTLTVLKDNKTITVLTDKKTRLKRKYFGSSVLSEMKTGDLLNIHGIWTDENKNTIQAVFIRDISIQKRFGAFVGTIKSLTSTGFVLTTVSRGEQTVTVNPKTRYVNRVGRTIDSSVFEVGNLVRVKGLWNNTSNTITEVIQVKIFNLPERKPTASPTLAP